MKKILLALLFLLGTAQMFLPVLAAAHRYAFDPKFANAFDVSKFSDEQRQVYQQFRIAVASDWNLVSYFGVATIVLGILFYFADRKRAVALAPIAVGDKDSRA